MKKVKTNAMRILDKAGIEYHTYFYNWNDDFTDGISVAEKIGQPAEKVFKTLVAQGVSKEYYVFVIPVGKELDVKAAARVVNEKAVELINPNDLNLVTGYVRGGCSPLGMKKTYRTVLDSSCKSLATIIISAGRPGYQIELAPIDLVRLTHCKIENITR